MVEEVIKMCQYDEVSVFNQGLASVLKDNYWQLIHPDGSLLNSEKYDEIGVVCNQLIAVAKNGKFGYVNLQGDTVIDLNYDYDRGFIKQREFRDKLMIVACNNK